jgi:hypothetical protein
MKPHGPSHLAILSYSKSGILTIETLYDAMTSMAGMHANTTYHCPSSYSFSITY